MRFPKQVLAERTEITVQNDAKAVQKERLVMWLSPELWNLFQSRRLRPGLRLIGDIDFLLNVACFMLPDGRVLLVMTKKENTKKRPCHHYVTLIIAFKVWSCPFGRFDLSSSNVHNLSMSLS